MPAEEGADSVGWQSYVDALFAERDRALAVAAEERGRTAEAVRTALAQQIDAGDKSLERHVTDQIASIRESLISAEKLRVEGLTRIEQAAIQAQRAIDKAEEAMTRRLDLLNEFRNQAADEAKKYALREVVDQQLKEVQKETIGLTSSIDRCVTIEALEQRLKEIEGRIQRVEFGPAPSPG